MTFPYAQNFLVAIGLAVLVASTALAGDDKDREGGLTGTGIVGEVTALGSIIVNDQRITFAPNMTVANRVAPKTAGALVPGDVVAVAVVPGNEGWTAEAISQLHPLIGPVSSVADNRFTVLGVDVLWRGAVPKTGDWVAISGFWARGDVIATGVETLAAQAVFSIQGSYRPSEDGKASMVGSVKLNIEPLRNANEGDAITVSGVLNGDRFSVTDVHLGLFEKPVGLVLAEGYLTDVAPSGHYTVAGSGLSAYTDNRQTAMTPERIRVCGRNGQMTPPQDRETGVALDRLGCAISVD